MSSARLTLLLSICCILFARVTFSAAPSRPNNGYHFTCRSICSKYLKGDTFNCVPASGYGLASGSLVIRLLSNLDWRYYKIRGRTHTKEYCKSILVADQFYSNANKTVCDLALHKNMYSAVMKARSSGDKLKTGGTSIEKLLSLLDDITKLAKKIQKEIMINNEKNNSIADSSSKKRSGLTDVGSEKLLPYAGSLAKNALKVSGLINSVNNNNTQNVNQSSPHSKKGPHHHSPNNVSNSTQNITRNVRTKRSVFSTERPEISDTEGSQIDTNDARTEALCYWASKNLCQQKQMLVCVEGICCWKNIKSKWCASISAADDIKKHRKNIYAITQTMRSF